MTKKIIVSTLKNYNGSKVNVIYTGVECFFFISDWGAVCYAEIDMNESSKKNKTVYRVYGDIGSHSFQFYTRKLKKLYKEQGISKPIDLICESVSTTFLNNIDITFKK